MSKKNILLLIVAIVVVAVFVFVITSNKTPQQQDQQQNQTNLDNGKEADTSDWQTYQNEEYGFEIKIPSDWPKFNIKESYPTEVASASIKIGFLTNDPVAYTEDGYAYVYGILIFTKDQYEDYYSPDGEKPPVLDQNEKYVFTKTQGHEPPRDLIEQWNGARKVFSTFKLIK